MTRTVSRREAVVPVDIRATRRGEVAQGLVATIGLFGLLIGLPLLLVALGHGLPLRTGLPVSEVSQRLTSRDNGTLLLDVLLAVGWVGWAGFAAGTVTEIAAVARGRSAPRLSIGPAQQLASRLVTTALLLAPAVHTPVLLNLAPISLTTVAMGPALSPHLVAQTSADPSAHTPQVPVVPVAGRVAARPANPATTGQKIYVVADPAAGHHDTLWEIAAKHLGDPLRWHDIFQLNQNRTQPDGTRMVDPALIRPGWRLTMPADAIDLPTATPPQPAEESTPRAPAPTYFHGLDHDHAQEQPGPRPSAADKGPTSTPTPDSTAGRSLEQSPRPSPAGKDEPREAAGDRPAAQERPEPHADSQHEPITTTGAAGGALGALVALGALTHLANLRRLQRRRRADGQTVPGSDPALATTEVALRVLADPLPAQQINTALRTLTQRFTGPLTTKPQELPVRHARLTPRDFRLHLAEPVQVGSAVSQDGNDWVLDVNEISAGAPDRPSLLPLLLPVGRQDSDLVLLDLERIGSLRLDGQEEVVDEILAALVTELATAPWSDTAHATLIGMNASRHPALAAVSQTYPEKVRVTTELTAQDIMSIAATNTQLHDLITTGVPEPVLAARTDINSEPFTAELLIFLEPVPPAVLDVLQTSSGPPTRRAHTIITTDETSRPAETYFSVTSQLAVLHPDDVSCVPFLLPATHARDIRDLAALTERPADRNSPVLIQDEAPGSAPLKAPVGTDACPASEVSSAERNAGPPSGQPMNDAGVVLDGESDADPDRMLDGDLAAYLDPLNTSIARIQILGPPDVQASGEILASRRSACLEIIVYLATRPRGADVIDLDSAIWPHGVKIGTRHQTLTRARTWLGRDDDGNPHLPLTGQGQLRLGPKVLTDWDLFVRLARRAQRRPATSIPDLKAALSLVRGKPFENVPTGRYGWLAENLLEQHIPSVIVDAAHQLASLYLDLGEPRAAREAATVARDIDPYDERPWRDLIRAAAAENNQLGVIKLRDQLLSLLGEEAEDDLTDETLELLRQVLA
jgi:DNA-binding SARP family transcriptional activator